MALLNRCVTPGREGQIEELEAPHRQRVNTQDRHGSLEQTYCIEPTKPVRPTQWRNYNQPSLARYAIPYMVSNKGGTETGKRVRGQNYQKNRLGHSAREAQKKGGKKAM